MMKDALHKYVERVFLFAVIGLDAHLRNRQISARQWGKLNRYKEKIL